ncbi:calcium-binding protein [Inquilinus sp. CA228]|uniref:calcium-binding protein n=1 Tax=Inquilinus sp. CA228 TaxID=3455609 RepID=UPI003F8D47F6
MAIVNGTAGNDGIHVAGDGAYVPVSYTDLPHATNGADTLNGLGGTDIIHGGGGDDLIDGGDGDDTLAGGTGQDTIHGGTGTDLVRYGGAAAVQIDLTDGSGHGGDAEGDVLSGIEEVGGTSFGDTLTGSAVANRLFGLSGNDILNGLDGADTLVGADGSDVLRGGAGADDLFGSAGIDLVSFYGAAAAVTVDLGTGTGSGGDAQGDTYDGLENVNGGTAGDTIRGNDATNVLNGYEGNDRLFGGDGGDSLLGGVGDDVLYGGAGADALDGGAGIDTASYYTGPTGVLVSLTDGNGFGGEAEGDTLSGIENVSGSQGNDNLIGNSGANVLQGWNGSDGLFGRAGKDTLTGGAGTDRYYFIALGDSVVGANADVVTDFSHAQADRIDLTGIDANTGMGGDQVFSFIGANLYSGVAGQLRYAVVGAVTTVAGDVDGDGASDFHIQLTGAIALVAADFVL